MYYLKLRGKSRSLFIKFTFNFKSFKFKYIYFKKVHGELFKEKETRQCLKIPNKAVRMSKGERGYEKEHPKIQFFENRQ